MLAFVIESTVFLGFSYGFYSFFLKKSRSFTFNRYYFLSTLLLALIVPFLKIDIGSSLPGLSNFTEGSYYTLVPISGEESLETLEPQFSTNSLLLSVYFSVVCLMLLRFIMNLIRLVLKAKQGTRMKREHNLIILTDEKCQPYSFFRNIYIDREIYKMGEEADKLLLHEGAHCEQGHSADILFAEFLKAFLWFNPFVWLVIKSIRLNHEYLADMKVLESQNRNKYQLLLVNMELANQSIYLASDFNYSLTKKRLAMMNYDENRKNMIIGKFVTIPLLLFLVAFLSFCEGEPKAEPDPFHDMEVYSKDWWRPILEKHDIAPGAYNNFESIFEMGSTNSIDENNVVTLTDALFLIRKDGSSYAILRSPLAIHNLESGIISGATGTLETFDYNLENTEPTSYLEMKNFIYELEESKHEIAADYMVLYEQGKEVMKGWTGTFEARDSIAIFR